MHAEGGEGIEAVRTYLLSVVAAAVICGVVRRLIGNKGTLGAMIRLLTGIILALTVMAPLAKVELGRLTEIADSYRVDGRDAAALGMEISRKQLAESITAQSEAYILGKAAAMGVTLSVEVRLTEEEIPRPFEVSLFGEVSPHAKAVLSGILTEDLGIEKENQQWN